MIINQLKLLGLVFHGSVSHFKDVTIWTLVLVVLQSLFLLLKVVSKCKVLILFFLNVCVYNSEVTKRL